MVETIVVGDEKDIIVRRPEDVKKLAELGIMRALPKMKTEEVTKGGGRLLGRLMKLEKITTQEIRAIKDSQMLFLMHKPIVTELLGVFGQITGWLAPDVPLCASATFCLKIVESSKFEYSPKIAEILTDIIEYYAREGIVPGKSHEEKYEEVVEMWNDIKVGESGELHLSEDSKFNIDIEDGE